MANSVLETLVVAWKNVMAGEDLPSLGEKVALIMLAPVISQPRALQDPIGFSYDLHGLRPSFQDL